MSPSQRIARKWVAGDLCYTQGFGILRITQSETRYVTLVIFHNPCDQRFLGFFINFIRGH
jgi:hypothetical protein